ncbi:phosphoribosyl 1,2-cyclic phosphodiesterase [Xaviernesmea oryzae]|uniref:Phosphoribosyl 1,2-cyclic phosphodiesterase n=1 Tax=Xaviernesmea oryzae TaxID=464029 RepID=A0A1Q9AWR3_9HYPH|nr:MBL fold metallo-hydrolase [Xaviernesmea oryzae]OLP59874.1 phosphoribosyl 1,2-cyclic phosphodiesterase [Xaviernesmea oryzae]SEK47791.1 phosphoribosyl 1,2-cyclic phosphate phosphodiesterase [Xaviernesmea oryzae]
MARRVFTILGCGSSPGVPRITGDWGACDPQEPKNRRLRASLLVEQIGENGGRTSVVIDTGPDFRLQMVRAGVRHLDAAVYTHSHADHLHGIDDLRGYVLGRNARVPIFVDRETLVRIEEGFSYCLKTPPGGHYPPIVEARLIDEDLAPFVIEGEGGAIPFQPLLQEHGAIHSLGFRIGDFAYCSDVSDFPEATQAKLAGLDTLVIDTLQYKPHPSHLSLEQSLGWIARIAPKRAILTHMHIPLDYATVKAATPDHVEPAFDGMTVTYEVPA